MKIPISDENSDGRCAAGTLTWSPPADPSLEMQFQRSAESIRLYGAGGSEVNIRSTGPGAASLDFTGLALSAVPAVIRRAAGLSALSGEINGMLEYARGATRAEFGIRELEFDTPDGRFAGAGLIFDLDLRWQPSPAVLQAEGQWRGGELLLGPAYLPSPVHPFSISLAAAYLDNSVWEIERASVAGEELLEVGFEGRMTLGDEVAIDVLDVELRHADLESLWRQGLESLAAVHGWGQLQPGGRLEGRLRIENDALAGLGLRLAESDFEDAAGRLDLQGLGAWVEWDAANRSIEARASWTDARLFRIPLGAAAFELGSREDGALALREPFRLPILDGALILDRLEWRDWLEADRQLDLDARLEPVDLARLTGILGWSEFGGRISGRFPGIRLKGNAVDVQGGLDVDLFDGKARIQDLSVERPFGALPALAADVTFDALDLEQVTGAFEFGRMLGLLSGHVRNLRLLDWQPVRFDAWVETLENSPEAQNQPEGRGFDLDHFRWGRRSPVRHVAQLLRGLPLSQVRPGLPPGEQHMPYAWPQGNRAGRVYDPGGAGLAPPGYRGLQAARGLAAPVVTNRRRDWAGRMSMLRRRLAGAAVW